jgi:3-dehydrotetronate 4-kinase
MQDHPLTPMRDPNLRRVLSRQTPHKVGFVPLATVDRGAEAVRADSRGCAERVAVTQFLAR